LTLLLEKNAEVLNDGRFCVGISEAATHIEETFITGFDEADLYRIFEEGRGPEPDRVRNGVPAFLWRSLEAWAICFFSPDDPVAKRVLLDAWFNGNVDTISYDAVTGFIDMEWHEEVPPTPEQIALWATERDVLDPILPEYEMGDGA
jgi:hypothetical protein